MSQRIVVEHLARVEGHGGITVVLDGDAVTEVRFDIFEGARLIEALLHGRSYEDIAPIVSRICAICSVAHTLTSLKATEIAFGIRISAQTELLRDLLYRGENIESHALHLFCLAVPDYLGCPSVTALAVRHPEAVQVGLRLKRLGNLIQETIGGRAIHPVNAVPGGFGKLPDLDQLIALRKGLLEGLGDCGKALDLFACLPPAKFCHAATAFAALRPGKDYGYYEGDEVVLVSNGMRQVFAAAGYRAFTNERPVLHSHAKHSLYQGRPFMVGSLARLTVNSDKLDDRATAFMRRVGLRVPSGNPTDNNKAQAVELICDVERSLTIVERLLQNGLEEEPQPAFVPRAGTGTAVTEAPRGLLFHSYTYDEEGRIAAADVITPTALNAASIEHHLRCTVEQRADRDAPALTNRLEMIVRAYDPCISCSVHLVRRRHAG